jgi:hypothetical protein
MADDSGEETEPNHSFQAIPPQGRGQPQSAPRGQIIGQQGEPGASEIAQLEEVPSDLPPAQNSPGAGASHNRYEMRFAALC